MGSTDDVRAPLMRDVEAALGGQEDPLPQPQPEQKVGFLEGVKRVLRELLSIPNRSQTLATAVDAVTLFVMIGSVAGLLYLALAGRQSGSVCYPSNPGLPGEVQAVLLIVPWVGIILGLCFLHQHRAEAPICSFSRVTLFQIFVLSVMSVWLAGCLGQFSLKICLIGALSFIGVSTVLWAWSHGCMAAMAERVTGRTGRRDRVADMLE